jgi:hypothetical protein
MLNVIVDANDEVTLSCSTAPRYLVNSSAVCQVKYLSLNSGVGTQIFRQQIISSNFIVISFLKIGSPCRRICYVQVGKPHFPEEKHFLLLVDFT